jgi:hypothetical protein
MRTQYATYPVICSPVDRRRVDDSPQLFGTIHDAFLTMDHPLIYLVNTPQLSKVDMRAAFDEASLRSRRQEVPTKAEDGDTRYVHNLEFDTKENGDGFQLRLDTMGGCSIQDEGLREGHDKLLSVPCCYTILLNANYRNT